LRVAAGQSKQLAVASRVAFAAVVYQPAVASTSPCVCSPHLVVPLLPVELHVDGV
jgi:hypothetical protein